MDAGLEDTLRGCAEDGGCDRDGCVLMMSFPEDSPEASAVISEASRIIASRTSGVGRIGAQIGVIIGPCYADCGFCSFASSVYSEEEYVMRPGDLAGYISRLTSAGEVFDISLMTVHNYEFDDLVTLAEAASEVLPDGVGLAVNTGDLSASEARELRSAGVRSAYHALRLGESIDNLLEPLGRYETIRNLRDAGIRVYTGVEPIGAEHSPDEIADLFYKAMGSGAYACSASARESVPGTRMAHLPCISRRRLLQIRSALVLSSWGRGGSELGFYGGYYGGFDRVMAEYLASPKDVNDITEKGLGRTVDWAKDELRRNGFKSLALSFGGLVPL